MSELVIDVGTVLQFFDECPVESHGHATAIVAILGEDLGIGLLCHYFQGQGLAAHALPGNVTMRKRRGPRLDRWVEVKGSSGNTVVYQVEVKNWSAHSLGGHTLPLNASCLDLAEFKKLRWGETWKGFEANWRPMAKVLEPFPAPYTNAHVEPLICFWTAMHPEGQPEPLFFQPLCNKWCTKLWVFSMSSYLRNLHSAGQRRLRLPMPWTAARCAWLTRFFPPSTLACSFPNPHCGGRDDPA